MSSQLMNVKNISAPARGCLYPQGRSTSLPDSYPLTGIPRKDSPLGLKWVIPQKERRWENAVKIFFWHCISEKEYLFVCQWTIM